MTQCLKCKKEFNRMTENFCKGCYEEQIVKGECLKIAAIALRNKYNPEHQIYMDKVFELTQKMFEESKKRKFLEW